MLTMNINRDYARRGWATDGETGHPAVPAGGPAPRFVVYYCRTYVKAVRGGGREKRGRVLWDATSRGLCGRVGPPRTNVLVGA